MAAKPTPSTTAERLARIETLLEEKALPMLESINTKVDADIADLAQLKNTGKGVLVGVSLVFTAFGVTVASWWKHVVEFFS